MHFAFVSHGIAALSLSSVHACESLLPEHTSFIAAIRYLSGIIISHVYLSSIASHFFPSTRL